MLIGATTSKEFGTRFLRLVDDPCCAFARIPFFSPQISMTTFLPVMEITPVPAGVNPKITSG